MADEKVTDSPAVSSPATVVKNAPETVEEDFVLPEDVKDEKSKARFQKLVERAKTAEGALTTYKQIGEPDQINQFVQYAQQLESTLEEQQARIKELEKQREPGEPKTTEQKDLEVKSKTIRDQLRQHEPLLTKMEKFLEEHESEKTSRIQALTLDAVEATADVMKDYGLPVTQQKVLEMADTLEPIIKKNPRLRFRFERDPGAAIKAAMAIYVENAKVAIEGRTRLESQRAREKTAGLPRSHGGGGGPGATKPVEPSKTIAEGLKRGLPRLRENGV